VSDLLPVLAVTAGDIHRATGWWVVGLVGAVGLIGIVLGIARREPGRWFWWLVGVAAVALLSQVGLGLWRYSVDGEDPGNQHVFYGVVVVFTLAFAYIYRGELAKRPALSYGALLLFLMGLGVRGISTFGQSFGS